MAWSYLQPRSSTVAATPTPTTTSFAVQPGKGGLFIPGPANENGYNCIIDHVTTDQIFLIQPLPYAPLAGEELIQTIVGDKDKVRLFCGDTDSDDPQLQDEEIATILFLRPSILRAAEMAAETIAAKLSRKVTYQIYQEIQERLTEQAQAYFALATRLRSQAARTYAIPFQGGLLQSDKDLAINDTTRTKPFFVRGMMSEPGTAGADIDEQYIGAYQPYY